MARKGLSWTRRYSTDISDVQTKEFECRILNSNGDVIFEQDKVVAPITWTDQGVTIFADKYFRGNIGDTNRETSVIDVINRVADTIWHWGRDSGYFKSDDDARNFGLDLKLTLIHQLASFNSPVWFNFGVPNECHQGSACFILEVHDDMNSITQRAVDESLLFQNGSGSGANNSRLRGSMEPLSRGGYASGPVSFMRGWDAFAGIIKSGGKTRRAAKMEILDVDHPDIIEFIYCKVLQERKAKALQVAGFGSGDINTMEEVFHQNANHSVRISDEFMTAVENDDDWNLIARNSREKYPNYTIMPGGNQGGIRMIDGGCGKIIKTVKAREIWDAIVACAYECGDPGVFFDDNINRWNTVPNVGRIESSNPCGEFLHPNNTACNLASINLPRFIYYIPSSKKIQFDITNYENTVGIMITAMDIIAEHAEYPTEKIKENSKLLRPLGLGYTGVGHMLMSIGVPYESIRARNLMARLTCLTTGLGYLQSVRIMEQCGFQKQLDTQNMTSVMDLHREEIENIEGDGSSIWEDVISLKSLRKLWDVLLEQGQEHGFRNSQATLMAPTGTISFGMDMGHSTGIEPIYMFLAMKKMAGAGTIILDTTQAVQNGLQALGIDTVDVDDLMKLNVPDDILKAVCDSHVFDTASENNPIGTSISPMGHVNMMAAIQPFLSGGISKTVNLPSTATHEDVSNTYMESWKQGLKAVALYRDGSKYEQPYKSSDDELPEDTTEAIPVRVRRAPPDEREGITHKAVIGGQKFYLTANHYPGSEKELCEIFVTAAKEGSAVRGLLDTVATLFSICIQYGVPLETLTTRFKDTRFEPNGVTRHPSIPIALSPMDYIMKWLELKFLNDEIEDGEFEYDDDDDDDYDNLPMGGEYSGNICPGCGGMTIRTGKCHTCTNCGETSGCG